MHNGVAGEAIPSVTGIKYSLCSLCSPAVHLGLKSRPILGEPSQSTHCGRKGLLVQPLPVAMLGLFSVLLLVLLVLFVPVFPIFVFIFVFMRICNHKR